MPAFAVLLGAVSLLLEELDKADDADDDVNPNDSTCKVRDFALKAKNPVVEIKSTKTLLMNRLWLSIGALKSVGTIHDSLYERVV